MADKTPSDFGLEPREKNVYLELDDIPKKSAGGIWLSDEQSTPSRIGTILAIGPGYVDPRDGSVDPVRFSVGDRVIISSISGEPLYLWQYAILDGKWRVVHETNILGKVTKE
jgi:co-chaperonin GroES (HSP10)